MHVVYKMLLPVVMIYLTDLRYLALNCCGWFVLSKDKVPIARTLLIVIGVLNDV